MKSTLGALAIAGTLLAICAATLAQSPAPPASPVAAPSVAAPSAMAPMKPPPTAATMMCRPAAPSEKTTAMMGTTGVVCKSMDKMMTNGMMMVPDTKSAADKVWTNWVQQAISVPRAGDA